VGLDVGLITPPHTTNQLLRNLKERQTRQIFQNKLGKEKGIMI